MNKETPFYNVIIGLIVLAIIGAILVVLKYFYKRKKWHQEKYEKQQTLLQSLKDKNAQQINQFLKDVIQSDLRFFSDQEEIIDAQENKEQSLRQIIKVLSYQKSKKSIDSQVQNNVKNKSQVKQGVKDKPLSKENVRAIKQLKQLCSKMTKQEYSELRQRIQQRLNTKQDRDKQALKQRQKLMLQQPNKTILFAFAQKLSLIGAFFNKDKKYLLKQLFILSLFCVSILNINKIELWPLALGFGSLILSFIIYEYVLKANWTCFDNIFERKNHQIHSGVELSSQVKEKSKSRLKQAYHFRHLQQLQIFQAIVIQNNEPIYPAISSSSSDNNLNFHYDANQDTNSNVFKPAKKNHQVQVSDVIALTQREKSINVKNRSQKVKLSPMKPKNILKQNNLNVQSPIKATRKQKNKEFNTKRGIIIENQKEYASETKRDKLNENSFQPRKAKFQVVFITLLSIVTLIMFCNSMFTIYNSISNLGPLNLASCAIMILIDQICVRGFLFLLTFSVVKILDRTQLLLLCDNKFIFKTICGDLLEQKVKQQQDELIYKQMIRHKIEELYAKKLKQMHSDNPDAEMSVSPARKKASSPSRVPKAIRGQKQNCDDTGLGLLQLQKTCMSKKAKSRAGRSQRKNVIGQCDEDQELQEYEINSHNKNKDFHSLSAQRPIKNAESILKAHNFNDDLVLVDNVLNYMEENDQNDSDDTQNARKFKDFTIDIDFSPTKHVRNRQTRHKSRKNRRQLLITGSSPYLQYLPDMMKKVQRSVQKGKEKKNNHSQVQASLVKKVQFNQTINANSKEKESHLTFEFNSRIL